MSGETSMPASDTQDERTPSALDVENTVEEAHRASQTFQSVFSFAGGMILGFLPLLLLVLNHLTISSTLFPFNPNLTFCKPRAWIPYSHIAILDTAAFILYPILACLGALVIVVIGKVFHWRRSAIILCVSGLLLAIVLDHFIYFVFLWPLAFRQCFHLVGMR
jgi:hypothetical protein